MRYIHGRKPRNPYNMIIQENHVASRANLIIHGAVLFVKRVAGQPRLTIRGYLVYALLDPNQRIKEMEDAIDAVCHKARKDVAKKKDQHIDDNYAIPLHLCHNIADRIWGNCV